MPYFDRSFDDIVTSSLDRLSENTNITQLSPGSKARFFIDTVGREQAFQHQIFDTNFLKVFIKYADSRLLDFFGDMFNVPRLEASHAVVDASEQNFMFYVSSGTFGDINNNANFVIPAGTIVQTVAYTGEIITPGIEAQPVVQYTITAPITARADQSFVYGSIRAVVEGDISDLPKNTLNQHDFASYVQASQNLLKCTNRYAISNGEDRESDESYRYRLSNIFRARNLAVRASIRLAALSVPGVSDIKDIIAEQGPGTFSIYVKSTTPTVSPRLLQEVSAVIQSVSAFGERPYVLAPETIGLEFVAVISWSLRATAAQKSSGYAAMRDAVEKTLSDLDIGESLVFSDLVDTMLQAAPLVQSIGGTKINTFDEVYIYRRNPLSSGTVRSVLSDSKVNPLYNEKIILETSSRHRGIQFQSR